MESQKNTKRNRCYSEGDIAEDANSFLKLRRDLSTVNDDDVDSEKSESGSESSDDDKLEQEIRKKEEELERKREELLKQKEKKKKKKQQKKEQNSHLHPRSLDSLTDQHSAQTDKVKFTLEEGNNANQYPIEENVALQEKRGVVVVCYHSVFSLKGHTLSSRPSAATDLDMMGNVWKKYGCEVLHFCNERNTFYEEDLIKKVKEKLDTIPQLSFFAFILSTHGEEKNERMIDGDANFQHYFYSKDGQTHTQTLINAIADIDGLQDKVKMFFIQACRSRANPGSEINNLDPGFQMEVIEKVSSKEGLQPKYNNSELSDSLRGITIADARGYMPPDDDDIQDFMVNEEDNPVEIEYEPAALFPHCEDSIVMFSSMSGKVAYSLANSVDEGGWLIKSLNDVLQSYTTGDEIFISDALIEVNRKVSQREAAYKKNDFENIEQLKAQSCFLHNITEELYLKRE